MALLLSLLYIAPDKTLADDHFIEGIVIYAGRDLPKVKVRSESKAEKGLCLLQEVETDDNGKFRVPFDPTCHYLRLIFSKAGYADALVTVNNSGEINDVGSVELERLVRAGARLGSSRSRFLKVAIGVVVALNIVAVVAAKKR